MFEFAKGRSLLKIMLCIGLFQIAGYYLAGALVRSDGGMALPQPDSLLYCQAARRIVEGYPFSFSDGTRVSTGTTSVLYPFALAVPYWMGCREDTLLRAAFGLNAVFYLLFLTGWCMVVHAKLRHPLARIVGAVGISTFGQTAFSAFAQSDIGLWLAVSSLFAAGLATERRWLYGSMLLLAPWIRPEGVVCVIAVLISVVVFSLWKPRRQHASQWDWILVALSIVSVMGVFALNYALTGHIGFSSVAHKGHFTVFPFCQAVFATACDFLKVVKPLLFGIPSAAPRDLYFVPVLGAFCMWIGVFSRTWSLRLSWHVLAWVLAIGGGLLTISQSGWQNTNVDRYIGWLLPTILLLTAEGIGCLAKRGWRTVAWISAGVVVSLTIVMGGVHMCMLHMTSRDSDLLRAFAKECDQKLEPGQSVGAWGDCGIAYEMSSRRLAHLAGIYSPEFFGDNHMPGAIEILKNEPGTRFDYWFCDPAQEDRDLGFKTLGILGEQICVGPTGYEFRKAKWDALSAAAVVPRAPKSDLRLRARVDVCYDADEKTSNYEVISRYNQSAFPPFLICGDLDGRRIIDGARLVIGSDSMSVDVIPGRDLWVVMRVYPSHEMSIPGSFGSRLITYAFSNPLSLAVTVNNRSVGVFSLKTLEKGFSDVSFRILGSYVDSSNLHITIQGDRIVTGYWFYQ